jgi:putative ABC transport system permease protein
MMPFDREALQDAWDELWHHKLRTALTLLGMVFGVGAVIAMLSIGEGAEREALKLIDAMGLRNIIVNARTFSDQEQLEIREHSAGLTLRDVEIAVETIPHVVSYSAGKEINTFLTLGRESQSDARAIGVIPSYFDLARTTLAAGRFLDDDDNRRYAQVAVLGPIAAARLFPADDPLDQLVKVNHVWLRVVGVLAPRQSDRDEFEGVKLGGDDNRIFIPLNTALERFRFSETDDEIDTFRLQLSEAADPIVVARTLSRLLTIRHGGTNDFDIVIPAELMAQDRETRRIFTIVMSCVAGISLLVGGIGIMNIMLASVLERTREIGLLRALGARKRDIVHLFLVESFTVSAVGGLLGIAFGFLIAQIIAAYAGWAVGWSFPAIILSVGACAMVGLIFGYYPAVKAAEMDPIEAIQRE